ncbi:hypothetical protein [Ectobacillus polymachus]
MAKGNNGRNRGQVSSSINNQGQAPGATRDPKTKLENAAKTKS